MRKEEDGPLGDPQKKPAGKDHRNKAGVIGTPPHRRRARSVASSREQDMINHLFYSWPSTTTSQTPDDSFLLADRQPIMGQFLPSNSTTSFRPSNSTQFRPSNSYDEHCSSETTGHFGEEEINDGDGDTHADDIVDDDEFDDVDPDDYQLYEGSFGPAPDDEGDAWEGAGERPFYLPHGLSTEIDDSDLEQLLYSSEDEDSGSSNHPPYGLWGGKYNIILFMK